MPIAAWLVHLYTASGFVLAFLAAAAIIDHDYRTAFFYLSLQVAVDATDGVLARAVRVSERLPWFSGSKLDDLVDYLTYAFVPALFVWRAQLVPGVWVVAMPAAMLVASGYGFSRDDAKTSDHFFTGFPSYWNIVALYLLLLGTAPETNLLILGTCVALVFIPIRYIYPSRTPVWPWPTNVAGLAWGLSMLVALWRYPQVSRVLVLASLAYPVYYVALSLAVQFGLLRRQRTAR